MGHLEIEVDIEKERRYEHLVHEHKQLLYEIKLGIILTIGGVIILVCISYILCQCIKKRPHLPRRQNNDKEKLIGSKEASEHLIHVHWSGKGKEYFV